MMRSRLVGVSLLALAVLAWPRLSPAQTPKTARGTVSIVAGNSISITVGAQAMTFMADSQTTVVAVGAGSKERRAMASGQPGLKLTDLVKAGQAVVVTYRDMGATMHANEVQIVSSAGPGGGSIAAEKPAARSADATVKSVSARSLTITAGGSDKTYTIDSATTVFGRGAGTKTAAAGGRIPITDLVSAGNWVSVTFNDADGMLRATSVRVTTMR